MELKLYTLKNGDTILLHRKRNNGKYQIGMHAINLNSPHLRIKTYNNSRLSNEVIIHETDARNILNAHLQTDFYQGVHVAGKHTSTEQTKKRLEQVCKLLDMKYVEPKVKEAIA